MRSLMSSYHDGVRDTLDPSPPKADLADSSHDLRGPFLCRLFGTSEVTLPSPALTGIRARGLVGCCPGSIPPLYYTSFTVSDTHECTRVNYSVNKQPPSLTKTEPVGL